MKLCLCVSVSLCRTFHSLSRVTALDVHLGRLETFGVGAEFYASRRAGLRADDDEAEAVVGGTLLRTERLVARRVAVVHGDDLAGAVDLEANPVLRARDGEAGAVRHAHRDEREVGAVGVDLRPVGLQRQTR